MTLQVITIPIGGEAFTQRLPKSEGLDLRSLGTIEIVRASHVVWCSKWQKWYIQFLFGELEGMSVTETLAKKWVDDTFEVKENIVVFDEYEDAVDIEHSIHMAAQLAGKPFCDGLSMI